MTALSDNARREMSGFETIRLTVADGDTIYAGSYVSLAGASFATTAKRGYAIPHEDSSGVIPMGGFAKRQVTGDTSASPAPQVELDPKGGVLKKASVTGASAQSDVGDEIYFDNDNDMTTSSGTLGEPMGRIIFRHADGTFDVLIYPHTTFHS